MDSETTWDELENRFYKLMELYEWAKFLKASRCSSYVDFDDHIVPLDMIQLGVQRGFLQHYEDMLYSVNDAVLEDHIRDLCLAVDGIKIEYLNFT